MNMFQVDSIVAYGDMNGRFDHMMGNINTLFTCGPKIDLPIYLIGSNSIMFLLTEVCSLQIDAYEMLL